MTNLLKLSVTAILFGAIFIVGINTITDAPDYTVHTENFNTSTYPATIQLSKAPIISGSLVVSNATKTIITTGNYSINYATGVITTTSPSNMTNNSIYKAVYNAGQQSTTLNTLVVVVMVLVVSVIGLLMILREAGIKIKF